MKIVRGEVKSFYPLDGYWLNKNNRAVGVALVYLEVEWDDGGKTEGRELLPVGEDLRVAIPKYLDPNGVYEIHVLGDYKDYLIHDDEVGLITT